MNRSSRALPADAQKQSARSSSTSSPERRFPCTEKALEAGGEGPGGDRKGERSATIFIVDKEEYPLWDIRVDAHPDPFTELRRLHDIFSRKLLPEIRRMPTRANPAGKPEEHEA